jgi:hypothetical protein
MKEIKKAPIIIKEEKDFKIKAVKLLKANAKSDKKNLYLDVDGTLVAMEFNPNYMAGSEVQ